MSQQINLFNPVFLKQKKYFSATTMVQALGLILVGSAVLSVYVDFQLTALGREAGSTSSQLKAAQSQLAKVSVTSGQRAKSKALEDEIQKTEAEVASLQRVFDVLKKGDFGNTKGYSEYLRAFSRQIVDGIWLTGFSIYSGGNDIRIQGRAMRPELVPAYINRLKREPVMQGKSFATLDMQAPPDPQVKGNASAATLAPAGYIEFDLRSSDAVKEQKPDGAGSK